MKLYLDSFMAWLVFIVFVAFATATPVMAYRYWRNSSRLAENVAGSMWFSSDEFRRGHARAVVPIILAGYPMTLVALFLFLIPPVPKGEIDYPGSYAVTVAAAGLVIGFLLYWSVVLFNRPKFIVPPRFREDHGALRSRRARLRERR